MERTILAFPFLLLVVSYGRKRVPVQVTRGQHMVDATHLFGSI